MDDHKLYNLKKLDEIAQGDNSFIREMVVTFIENVSAEIDSIQMLMSLEKWTDIGETAHKLASNFAYLGADKLHALAGDIEKSVLIDCNLTGVADKTKKMCDDGILLNSQLKKKFNIIDTE